MADEVRVGIIAGAAQVVVGLIALVGTLVNASTGDRGPGTAASATPASTTSSPTGSPIESVPCLTVMERYRTIVLSDANVLPALTTPGPDGTTFVRSDPKARRCNITEVTLQGLR